ncbi:hypothetical protein BZA77DRAFT_73952 [Pyronema omphalodes]|nr:hypothetical protein BZA77DRAFT_73952 [Pyronema omphalodes]
MSRLPAPPAANLPAADVSENPDEAEAKLLEQLRELDELHTRLIGLRTIMPTLLWPIRASYPDPSRMFDDLSHRVLKASEDIKVFNQKWVKNTHVFENAQKSSQDTSTPETRLYPHDLFLPPETLRSDTEVVEIKVETPIKTAEDEEPQVRDTTFEEIEEVIEEFSGRLMHRNVKIEHTEDKIIVNLPPPANLSFTISLTPHSTTPFTVTSVSTPPSKAPRNRTSTPQRQLHLHNSIMRSISGRQWPGNLEVLLEMLASYKTIFTETCEKCKSVTTGQNLELATVRKAVLVKGERKWVAAHEGCC